MRLQKIEDIVIDDHHHLTNDDACYFFGEYFSGSGGHQSGVTNQDISNFKKTLERKGKPEWKYKEKAINKYASMLKDAMVHIDDITFIPIPPSKSKGDPMYDDRLIKMLKTAFGDSADVRELVVQKQSTNAVHMSSSRPTIQDLTMNYEIDENLCSPLKKSVVIVDDVLTTGAHFKAVKLMLTAKFGILDICGVFLARRAFANPLDDFEII